MKWAVTINLAKFRIKLASLFILGRTYLILTLCSMFFFIALGLAGMIQTKVPASPVTSMKGLASALSSRFFADMIGLEMPYFTQDDDHSAITQKHVLSFLFQYVTNIDPNDPRSLLAREVPGLGAGDAVLLSGGGSTDPISPPLESMPPPATWKPASDSADSRQPAAGDKPNITPTASDKDTHPTPDKASGSDGSKPADGSAVSKKKAVFIYHSHNRESFFPELKDTKYAEDDNKNITLVGLRLADKLKELGIGAVHSNKDYASTTKNYNWSYSYKYSEQTVQEAVAANPDLQFFFDIHRDSQKRKKTTVSIKGVDYAQVFFIIGQRNPHWDQNYEFAKKIRDRLEEGHPGITRGVWNKSVSSGHGEYNQSISPNSVLIEIGGVDNTFEEAYRTADVLAKVIADLYWDAEKVSADRSGESKKQ